MSLWAVVGLVVRSHVHTCIHDVARENNVAVLAKKSLETPQCVICAKIYS